MIDTKEISYNWLSENGKTIISVDINSCVRILDNKIILFKKYFGEIEPTIINKPTGFKIFKHGNFLQRNNYKLSFKTKEDNVEKKMNILVDLNFWQFILIRYKQKKLWINKKWFWFSLIYPLILLVINHYFF